MPVPESGKSPTQHPQHALIHSLCNRSITKLPESHLQSQQCSRSDTNTSDISFYTARSHHQVVHRPNPHDCTHPYTPPADSRNNAKMPPVDFSHYNNASGRNSKKRSVHHLTPGHEQPRSKRGRPGHIGNHNPQSFRTSGTRENTAAPNDVIVISDGDGDVSEIAPFGYAAARPAVAKNARQVAPSTYSSNGVRPNPNHRTPRPATRHQDPRPLFVKEECNGVPGSVTAKPISEMMSRFLRDDAGGASAGVRRSITDGRHEQRSLNSGLPNNAPNMMSATGRVNVGNNIPATAPKRGTMPQSLGRSIFHGSTSQKKAAEAPPLVNTSTPFIEVSDSEDTPNPYNGDNPYELIMNGDASDLFMREDDFEPAPSALAPIPTAIQPLTAQPQSRNFEMPGYKLSSTDSTANLQSNLDNWMPQSMNHGDYLNNRAGTCDASIAAVPPNQMWQIPQIEPQAEVDLWAWPSSDLDQMLGLNDFSADFGANDLIQNHNQVEGSPQLFMDQQQSLLEEQNNSGKRQGIGQTQHIMDQPPRYNMPPPAASMVSQGAPAAPMTTGLAIPPPANGIFGGLDLHSSLPVRMEDLGSQSDQGSCAFNTPEVIRARQQRNAQMARDLARDHQERLSDTCSARDDNYNSELASYQSREHTEGQHQAARQDKANRQRLRIEAGIRSGRSPSIELMSKHRNVPAHMLPTKLKDSATHGNAKPKTRQPSFQNGHRHFHATEDQMSGDESFSPEQVAAFTITEIDTKIGQWKDMGMAWAEVLALSRKMTGEAHNMREIQARYNLMKLKSASKRQSPFSVARTPAYGTSPVHAIHVESNDEAIPRNNSVSADMPGSQGNPVQTQIVPLGTHPTGDRVDPSELTTQSHTLAPSSKIQLFNSTAKQGPIVVEQQDTLQKEKEQMARELDVEREKRMQAEKKAAEKAEAANEAKKKAVEEEQLKSKAEKEERVRMHNQKLAEAGKSRNTKVGRATGTGFSFPQDTSGNKKAKQMSRSTGKAAVVIEIDSEVEDCEGSKPVPFPRSKSQSKRSKSKKAQQEVQGELNAKGFATKAGKSVVDISTLNKIVQYAEEEREAESEYEEPTTEEILDGDLTYYMYLVKRKSWTEDDEPKDDENDLVLTLGTFTSRIQANTAVAEEILRYSGGDPDIVVDPSKPYSVHSDPKRGGELSVMRADVPNGHIKVWVEPEVRARFRGALPKINQADFINKEVYVVREETRTANEGDCGGDGNGGGSGGGGGGSQSEVEEVGDIYTTLSLANTNAANRLIDKTFHTQARRIDEFNAQKTSARWELDSLLEEMEEQEEAFCMERQNKSGQAVKVWVESRQLAGPRN